MIPIGLLFVILSIAGVFWATQSKAQANEKDIANIKATYVTREILDLKLQPVIDGIGDIKKSLNQR